MKKIFYVLLMIPLFLSCSNNNVIDETSSINDESEKISDVSSDSDSKDELDILPPQYGVNIPMIAHKGYHVKEVENTYDAFVEAGKRSFYGIETDIYMTKDSYWICNHDNNIKVI